jgi:DNA-binding NarL/FixJ family response regulator
MEKLTHREQEVSDCLILGMQNKRIANQLGISYRTVEDHRATIFRKREVHNAIELTRKVLLDDLVKA